MGNNPKRGRAVGPGGTRGPSLCTGGWLCRDSPCAQPSPAGPFIITCTDLLGTVMDEDLQAWPSQDLRACWPVHLLQHFLS